MAPTSSGSASSERAVNPTRSQKRTVTRRRSSPARVGVAREAPQAPQNRKPSGLSCPQAAQRGMGEVYGARPDGRLR
jgi:hypothetical protein